MGGYRLDSISQLIWVAVRPMDRDCVVEATIKFFDGEGFSNLVSYDNLPNWFVGIPSSWLRLFGNNKFEAGEPLDAGPVVLTGTCQRID
jgi:hypothetical protein